jgi:hypothetical protein
MDLFRLHAYAISPQRGANDTYEPEGGAVAINEELRRVISENLTSAAFDSRTRVDFDVDTATRTNHVRDLIVTYAFGEPAQGRAAAVALASRLSTAMDLRSTPCLFIPAAFREDDRRTVTLWTFPRDEAFRLRQRRSGPSIQILTDIFSKTSRLRKAAQFLGRNLRNHFLSGRVLDFQANHASKDVADFWITRFLQCRFGLAGDAGTRLLARTIRKAFDECQDPADQEELYTAVMAMRRSPHKRVSLEDFADRYLSHDGNARQAFLRAIPNTESRSAVFDFQTAAFDATLQFRVFQLDTGVFVSSPLTQIGDSVRIAEGTEKKRLSCEGAIVEERLRTRHA